MKLRQPIILLFLSFTSIVFAQDQSLSPYFQVLTEDLSEGDFPLLHTGAKAKVSGLIVEIEVEQLYHNTGKSPIEAVYVFPGSTRAAVHGMEMQIGERRVIAQIQEKEKARAIYEQAQQEGKRASLLEQSRPNIFQMNVANIMPGDTIRTILKYTELLVPEEGNYQFVYPTVVGPRFTGESKVPAMLAAQKAPEGIPYLPKGSEPSYTFDFKMTLNGGMPVKKLESATHKIQTTWENDQEISVALHPTEKYGGNRDLMLKYSLRGAGIETGMLRFEGEEENHFLFMVQPPERVQPTIITPREYIFIVDVSGSMNGFPLDVSKDLMRQLLGDLRSTDRFNVMVFASKAGFFAEESVPVTSENINHAIQSLDKIRGGGGTRLLNALQKAMTVPKIDGFSRSFVTLTDGYVSVEANAFQYIRNQVGVANFFAFGIGSSVNHHLIEGMARAGGGEPFVVTQKEGSEKIVSRFRKYIEAPLLTDIKIRFEGMEAYDILPTNYPDLMGERPLIVMGKYRNKAKGNCIIEAKDAKGKFTQKINIDRLKGAKKEEALKRLWARTKIQNLNDFIYVGGQMDDGIKEVTQLGLKYSLLTSYTSFVAVDNEVVNLGGNGSIINQPLPLPQGVPHSAVGFSQNLSTMKMSTANGFQPLRSMSPPPPPMPPVIEEVPEEIFSVTEEQPRFSGCESEISNADRKSCADKKMLEFIYKHLKWSGPKGTHPSLVVAQFVVSKDGSIKDIKIVRGTGGAFDQEVIRVIGLMPRWIAGRQNRKAVDVVYNLPIRVHLE